MCGRYAAAKRPNQLVEEFEIDIVGAELLAPDYNVAPTKAVYAVVAHQLSQSLEPDSTDQVRRELQVMHWGLIPSWAKDVAIGSRLINARVETVAEKPAFRRAFVARRCLVPADGYYEWYRPVAAGAKKQPFFISARDGASLPMAGLYEVWQDPLRDRADPAGTRTTLTVITTAANNDVSAIHDRMPVLIDRDHWQDWLDPNRNSAAAALDLIAALRPVALTAVPVSTAVNRTINNGPGLIAPMAAVDESVLF